MAPQYRLKEVPEAKNPLLLQLDKVSGHQAVGRVSNNLTIDTQ